MSKAWLIGGGVFLGVLLVASVIVALLESEETLPEGTPEAAVQSFLTATEDENLELAYSFLSTDLQEDCAVEKFAAGDVRVTSGLRDARVTLEKRATVKDTVFVTVRVTHFRGSGPFDSQESAFEQRFALRRDGGGQWRFTEYPWPFSRCGPFSIERPGPVPPRPDSTPIREPRPTPVPES